MSSGTGRTADTATAPGGAAAPGGTGTVAVPPPPPRRPGSAARTARRLRALGRAEMTLLARNRGSLFVVLAVPLLLTFSIRQSIGSVDLSGTGLSLGTVVIPGSIGYVLLFAVYSTLVGTYVARREELVLKRLRTGEASDAEILAGGALPALVIGLGQCVLLLAGGGLLLHLAPPERPVLVAAGLLLGLAMMVAVAAACAGLTRSNEAAQITPLPFILVSMLGSGVVVPLEVLPDTLRQVCAWLPVSPLMELVRGGWVGTLGAAGAARAVGVAVAWTALAVVVVRRSFRWEPRR